MLFCFQGLWRSSVIFESCQRYGNAFVRCLRFMTQLWVELWIRFGNFTQQYCNFRFDLCQIERLVLVDYLFVKMCCTAEFEEWNYSCCFECYYWHLITSILVISDLNLELFHQKHSYDASASKRVICHYSAKGVQIMKHLILTLHLHNWLIDLQSYWKFAVKLNTNFHLRSHWLSFATSSQQSNS